MGSGDGFERSRNAFELVLHACRALAAAALFVAAVASVAAVLGEVATSSGRPAGTPVVRSEWMDPATAVPDPRMAPSGADGSFDWMAQASRAMGVMTAPDAMPSSSECGSERGSFMDARVAAIRVGLELTPTQEPAWRSFEPALRARIEEEGRNGPSGRRGVGRVATAETAQGRAGRTDEAVDGPGRYRDAVASLLAVLDEAARRRLERLYWVTAPLTSVGPGCGVNR